MMARVHRRKPWSVIRSSTNGASMVPPIASKTAGTHMASGSLDLPLAMCVPAVLLAIGGTMLAPFVLERMTDHGFRRWTRAIIFAVSVVYLARAISLAVR